MIYLIFVIFAIFYDKIETNSAVFVLTKKINITFGRHPQRNASLRQYSNEITDDKNIELETCQHFAKNVSIRSRKTDAHIEIFQVSSSKGQNIILKAETTGNLIPTKWNIEYCNGFYVIKAVMNPLFCWEHKYGCENPQDIVLVKKTDIGDENKIVINYTNYSFSISVCNRCVFIDKRNRLTALTDCSGEDDVWFYLSKPKQKQ